MGELDALIAELCPDGVIFEEVGKLSKTLSPPIKIKKNDYLAEGTYPIIDQGQEFIGGYTNEESVFTVDEYIVFGDHTCVVKYIDFAFAQGADGVKVIKADSTRVLPKYLYYCMSNIKLDISYARHWSKIRIEKVPVPPLEVQRKIVCILDALTELTSKLILELTSELTSRKKQYEFYRSKLLVHDIGNKNVKLFTLNEAAKLFRGAYITKKECNEGKIPVILGGQEPAYYIDKSNHEGEIIVVARSGVSAGFVTYWNEPIYVTDGFGYEAKTEIMLPKYLYYVLKNKENELNNMKRGAGVPHVSGEMLGNVSFLVPDLATQKQIVDTLNYFETICTGLNTGLLAEIEARQKQYEYYRDKLLTFKELCE